MFLMLISISIFELHFLLYFATCILYYAKVSKKLVNIISYLIIIILIALFSSFFNQSTLYNWVKDLAYFMKPILGILAGFLISKKINNFKVILKIILSVSLFFAIIHIFKIIFGVDFSTANVSDVRQIGGISNEIEVFSIAILIVSYKVKEVNLIKNGFYKKVVLAILILSFILYFSRTMIVSLIIFLLAVYGYLRITSKGVKYASLVLLFFGLFYVYLFNADIKRNQSGFESFLYKMKNAPAEIFLPVKNIDINNHAKLWDRWRAYEASMAINQIGSFTNVVFGKGLGAMVDLKFKAPLGNSYLRFIPTLHNGYVTIFYKTGIIGLILYLILLFLLYSFSKTKSKNPQNKITGYLIGGLAIHYFFTTLIVTGMYNIMEPFIFVLGILLYYSLKKEKVK